jgi:hypothetical protein
MKKHLLIFFLSIATLGATAQKYNAHGFIIPEKSLRTNFASTYEAKGYINNMLDKISWQENFQVREQNGINNAYATIIRNERYIVYDNKFLENIDRYAGTKLASISVLAHEMGHHYYNHVVNGAGSSLDKELEADYFSGYMMNKMGASLSEAEAAMSQIASPSASSTHPGKTDRLNAIAKGWNSSTISKSGAPVSIPAPAPSPTRRREQQRRDQQQQPPQQPTTSTADATWIQLSLYGNENMTVYLSDDGRTFNTADLKNSEPFVFKYDMYEYGWLRFGNNRNAKTYKLYHGRDYAIVWNRRTNNWSLLEIS